MSLECQKCEDNFCCIYLGQRTCTSHCWRQNCFCVSCQLYNIKEKSLAVVCQKCNFLSECYAEKYFRKIRGRESYILQRHCIDHCQLENCPHRDEATVELSRQIQPPNYSPLIQHDGSSKAVDIHQQDTGTQQLEDRETPIPSGKGYPRMVPRVPKQNRSGPKGLLATKRTRGTRGGRGRTSVRGSPLAVIMGLVDNRGSAYRAEICKNSAQ
jgi:hypothetical protein